MGVVYKINCSDCNICYIGQTMRYLEKRINEHKSDVRKDASCQLVVSKHRICNDHEFDWLNTVVLHQESHRRKREITEMYFIKTHSNTINIQGDTDDFPVVYESVLNRI
ncbi:hypothetical protein X777_02647 [Ooceraea biroi]|uniref:GIY-YIG domain-containing protein n=1 Tax=Ooceraea biroi TaxID=2015173 RepID=A0A026WQK1_OOCBI|nr:hypothetical protein X777_02647 [Ooceraea biroi]